MAKAIVPVVVDLSHLTRSRTGPRSMPLASGPRSTRRHRGRGFVDPDYAKRKSEAKAAGFRDLIPLLADRFHIVAPDLVGFGQTEMPSRKAFSYTFDNIAAVIDRFTEVVGLKTFAIYVFDYGAPTGFRIALKHPERVTAIITQNGNAYEEGLSEGWNPIQAYWKGPSEANRSALRQFLTVHTADGDSTSKLAHGSLDSFSGDFGVSWLAINLGLARTTVRIDPTRVAISRCPAALLYAPPYRCGHQ